MAHLFSKGLLEEYFRLRFVTIFNAPSLETKQKLFFDFFNQKINTFSPIIQDIAGFKTYVQTQVNARWIEYTELLKTTAMNDVNVFAFKCADNIYNLYNQNKVEAVNVIANHNVSSFSWKPILYVVGFVVTAFVIYKVYQLSLFTLEIGKELKKTGASQTTLAKEGLETDVLLGMTNENVDNLNSVVSTLKVGLGTAVANHDRLVSTVTNNVNHLKEGLTHLNELYASLKDLIISGEVKTNESVEFAQKLLKGQQDIVDLAIIVHDTNNNHEMLCTKVDNIISSLSTLKSEILSERNVNNTPILEAAINRKMDFALEKIKDFDPENIIKNIKMNVFKHVEDFTKKSEHIINEALTDIKSVSEKCTTTLSNVEASQRRSNRLLSERTEIDTKTTEAIHKLDTEQKTIFEKINENKERITTLREDFNSFKEFVINNSKIFHDKLEEIKTKLEELSTKKVLPSVITTMRKINNDNRLISFGSQPNISASNFNPLRTMTGLLPFRRNNNNNNSTD